MPSTQTLPSALAAPLNRLAARYAASPLPRFFAWWGGELRGLLPARWQAMMTVESAQLVLEPIDQQIRISRLERGAVRPVAELSAPDRAELPGAFVAAVSEPDRNLPRVLLFPADKILRRRLTLPAAAAENLRNVIGFELDRQTPFKPDQVYYDCRVVRREPGAKLVDVELALVPRPVLDSQLAALDGLAQGLDAADARDEAGQPLGYNFLPAERRVRRRNVRVWINLGLIAASVAMLWLAAWQSLENRRTAVAELEAQVDARRTEARQVSQLREALQDAVEGANFLAVRRAEQSYVLDLLRELTVQLPDDTYLERLTFNAGEVNMTGQSTRAAELLSVLQKSERLQSPALSGSIQPDNRTGKDRFTITSRFAAATVGTTAPPPSASVVEGES